MKMEHLRSRPVVAILGGGVAGAATAHRLAHVLAPDAADIVVVEPRETVGPGLAYSTADPAHRINVPAAKMSLIADPYDGEAIAAIGPADRVLILGTGLTSADVIASLDRRGFTGEIVALSRRGLRSRGHGATAQRSTADFETRPAVTAHGLLRRIRDAITADARKGLDWQATIDRVRDQGQAIWRNLDAGERARLVRHLRPFWDVHRFRLPPQVEEALARHMARGRLTHTAARVIRVVETDGGIVVEYRRRGRADTIVERFDRVVLTTGPAHGDVLRSNPVLRALASADLLSPDPLGLGLKVADLCHAVDGGGEASDTLLVAGPLARGHVGELMGVPEVVAHAREVAEAISARLARRLPPARVEVDAR